MRRMWRRNAIDEVFDRLQKWRRRRDELEPDEIAFLPSVRGNGRQMPHASLDRGRETIDCKVHRLNGFDGNRAARVEERAVCRDVHHTHGFVDPERSPAGAEDLESRMLPPIS